MTVKELIAQLQMIENKDAEVIIENDNIKFITCDLKQYKMVRHPYKQYFLTPVKKVFKHEVMVVVGNEVFYNDIWDMRKFKLNMIKMFGKGNIEYKQLSKKYCAKFKDTYSAFKKIEKALDTTEEVNYNGFDKIVTYVADQISINKHTN